LKINKYILEDRSQSWTLGAMMSEWISEWEYFSETWSGNAVEAIPFRGMVITWGFWEVKAES